MGPENRTQTPPRMVFWDDGTWMLFRPLLYVHLEEKDKKLHLVQAVVNSESVMERVGLKGWLMEKEDPLRSTLVRQGEDNAWLIVEFCSRYMEWRTRQVKLQNVMYHVMF